MSNTYTTANSKKSVPLNWNTNTVVGGGVLGTMAGSNGTYAISNTADCQISPILVIQNEPASLDVKGKIVHNGRDLEDRLSTIEKMLMIPERDVIMEKKYPKLKKMYEEYIKELSKYRMWDELKGDNNA